MTTSATHPLDRGALNDRFVKLCRTLNDKIEHRMGAGWFQVLQALYDQPHRKYHTLDHIAGLLVRLDQALAAGHGARALEVEVAIWFHDAIYRVPSSKNEAESCGLAMNFLRTLDIYGDEDGDFTDRIRAAILATTHDGRDLGGSFTKRAQSAAMLMVDLDLAGFADPHDLFEENNAKIRAEYRSISDEAYRWGRVKFLSGLMNRKIFNILTDLEAPARANIERHLADLISDRL